MPRYLNLTQDELMTQFNIFKLIGVLTGNLPNLRASEKLLDRGLPQFLTIATGLVRENIIKPDLDN